MAKVGLAHALLSLLLLRLVTAVNHLETAVDAWATGGGDLFQSTFEAVIEASNLILGAEITLSIEPVDDGNVFWRRGGAGC